MNDRLAKRRNSPVLQFNLRMLFELLLLCGLLISLYQWWDGRRHLEPTRVRGADRAVILENEECVKVPRQMAVTDPAELEAIMDGLADCIRVPQFNRCMPARYTIELYSGGQPILSARPTACCGIFDVDGVLYRDNRSTLRNTVDRIIASRVPEVRPDSAQRGAAAKADTTSE